MENSGMDQKQYIFGSVLILNNKLQGMKIAGLGDLTIKQFILLISIRNMENPAPSIQETADILGSTRQNVKKMLEILEREGYVAIQKSKDDRRSFCVSLTDKCFRYFEQHNDAGEKIINVLFDGMKEEDISSTYRVINTLFENIDKVNKAEGITI